MIKIVDPLSRGVAGSSELLVHARPGVVAITITEHGILRGTTFGDPNSIDALIELLKTAKEQAFSAPSPVVS